MKAFFPSSNQQQSKKRQSPGGTKGGWLDSCNIFINKHSFAQPLVVAMLVDFTDIWI